jgi:pimeloyl-ACP methyl ester carboxylesterase
MKVANVETGWLAGRVPYIRGGCGEREAVILFGVNALLKRLDQTSNPGRYARQISRLLPGYRFTILGYAGSGFDEMVRDLADVIPTPPDLVVGISFGGFVAMRFAAEYPELVRRLVLLVAAHRFSSSGWRMMERQFEALEREDLRTFIRENALLFRRPWYNWLVRLKLRTDANRLTADFRAPAAILHDYRQLFGPKFKDNGTYARRIVCPTLVIGGTADQYFDRDAAEETASLITGARIHLFEGETHMLPIEQSRRIAGVIADFSDPS